MENGKGLIYELIPKIMGELGPIGKDKENKEQHFKYRSIDQFYNAANPLFSKYGLFTVPEIQERTVREYSTKSGSIWQHVALKIKYTVYAKDGSCVWGSVEGAGSDPGDKGDNKAMAIGHKYFLMQILCVATEDLIDPDNDIPEEEVKTELSEGQKKWKVAYDRTLAVLLKLINPDLSETEKKNVFTATCRKLWGDKWVWKKLELFTDKELNELYEVLKDGVK